MLLSRQRYLCRDCGRYFLGDAIYYSRELREEALKMYSNSVSPSFMGEKVNSRIYNIMTTLSYIQIFFVK
ncbi:hypothetical protein M164_2808 [Sulfolobus islandicus M.16.4]|uniref:Uncharacterized protein n=1 Tax=Saccharolobus islandicus (strain M.16.4 / Kamchatka \|nr:hypothetical protein M164_2808 [Sulfolobus islandicus M.16.4]